MKLSCSQFEGEVAQWKVIERRLIGFGILTPNNKDFLTTT
jgi:hypothetical protein